MDEYEKPQFPMRINKYLAMEGRGSRREMDVIIAEGKVFINGAQAVLGSKVSEGDKVEIRFRGGKQGPQQGGQREQR
jgi:16S rRNA U516 pseudouridylate synthase RsuA-like enzyme